MVAETLTSKIRHDLTLCLHSQVWLIALTSPAPHPDCCAVGHLHIFQLWPNPDSHAPSARSCESRFHPRRQLSPA